jgi:hypothetical protein
MATNQGMMLSCRCVSDTAVLSVCSTGSGTRVSKCQCVVIAILQRPHERELLWRRIGSPPQRRQHSAACLQTIVAHATACWLWMQQRGMPVQNSYNRAKSNFNILWLS